MKMATCHPNRKAMAKGLCSSCYKRENRHKWNVGSKGRKAECHPDKPHYCKGLCKTCYIKRFKQDNPDKEGKYKSSYTEKLHGYMLKYRFGITPEQYSQMFEKQGGVCAVCGKPENGNRRMSVDHDHKTGKVRGLLCQRCNTLVGMSKESTGILKSAISYLRSHKEK